MSYAVLYGLHVVTVCVSISLFVLRGVWMFSGSPHLQAKWVRIAPHVNDTLLLLAAVSMLIVSSMNPLEQSWLLAKFVALLIYIGLGMVALKFGKTRQIKVVSFIAAILVFLYLVTVAFTKNPAGLFSLI